MKRHLRVVLEYRTDEEAINIERQLPWDWDGNLDEASEMASNFASEVVMAFEQLRTAKASS